MPIFNWKGICDNKFFSGLSVARSSDELRINLSILEIELTEFRVINQIYH